MNVLLRPQPVPSRSLLRNPSAGWYRLASWLFASKAVPEAVATQVRFNLRPEAVWNYILFYEEVPGPRPFFLQTLLPRPVRTEGDKTRVGATVRCAYSGGELIKRVTKVEPPHFLQFSVVAQRLGIEGCVLTLGGSYQIHSHGDSTDLVLTTNYHAYLHPRCLWRPLEALLIHQLHRHILDGINAAISRRASVESLARCTPSGVAACTVSRSSSLR